MELSAAAHVIRRVFVARARPPARLISQFVVLRSARPSVSFARARFRVPRHASLARVRLRRERARVGGGRRVSFQGVPRSPRARLRRRRARVPREHRAALPRLLPRPRHPRARVAPARALPAARLRSVRAQVRDQGRGRRRRAQSPPRRRPDLPREILQLPDGGARGGVPPRRRRAHRRRRRPRAPSEGRTHLEPAAAAPRLRRRPHPVPAPPAVPSQRGQPRRPVELLRGDVGTPVAPRAPPEGRRPGRRRRVHVQGALAGERDARRAGEGEVRTRRGGGEGGAEGIRASRERRGAGRRTDRLRRRRRRRNDGARGRAIRPQAQGAPTRGLAVPRLAVRRRDARRVRGERRAVRSRDGRA